MGISARAPRETGEPAPAHEFGQQPQRGKQQAGGQRTVLPARLPHQRQPGLAAPT